MAKVYLDLSDEFNTLRAEMLVEFRKLSEYLCTRSTAKDLDWLTLSQAKEILGYESKKKWKELRDSGKVDFSKLGRSYKYYRPSLVALLEANSTIKPKRNKL